MRSGAGLHQKYLTGRQVRQVRIHALPAEAATEALALAVEQSPPFIFETAVRPANRPLRRVPIERLLNIFSP